MNYETHSTGLTSSLQASSGQAKDTSANSFDKAQDKSVRACQNCKQNFTIELDDFAFYETIHVPPPTWCPQCRLIRRLSWLGYRILYKRKCDYTGEMVISTHHPDSPHKVYRQDIWWSDKWDPKSYGRDYDFSRPFFEQFKELLRVVPMPALNTEYTTMVRSDYCNAAATLKDCYLCFKADYGENSAYLNAISNLKECFDSSYANFSELSYAVVNVNKCYQAFYSEDCNECQNIYFSKDLVGCSNCIACIGLRSKSYHIFNKPYSKEEYEKIFKSLDLGSYAKRQEFSEKAKKFLLTVPNKEYHGRKIVNSSGDYLWNCKNVKDSYMVGNGEDLHYCQFLKTGPAAKCYDYSEFSLRAEWIYESCWVGLDVNTVKFGIWDYHVHDMEYSFGCHGSGNLFGCVGVRNSEYCIFNKQYSKEEYLDIVAKIKKQMVEIPYIDSKGREYRYGEYFPSEICPWTYNESTAYQWFPFLKEEALKQGFNWRDSDAREYQPANMQIPDHIRDVTDDILKGILKCENCGKNYQIIKKELDFYRRFQIPIPRNCPLCRDRNRIKQLNPIALYNRKCMKCDKDIQTSYAPDRKEIVYCEQCYQSEVV